MKKKTALKKTAKTTCNTSFRLWLLVGFAFITTSYTMGSFTIVKTWLTENNQRVASQPLVDSQPIETPSPRIAGKPVRIVIQKIGIDLEVIPGYYDASHQSWTLSLDKAQWGAMTADANNKSGMTYIYAHNRKNVFNTLPQITTGDQVVVTSENGHTFLYAFKSSTTTKPTDTSIFDYKGAPILVLQTCTGVWYENRQLFVFELISNT